MTDLPEVNAYNALMVILDKMGKLSRLVPFGVGENQLTAAQEAKLLFENWVCFFRVPKYVVYDRDVCFTASFWKTLWSIMGTHTLFSSVYHP